MSTSASRAKSRISLIVGSLRGGGTERVCVSLANELAARGHEVEVVALNLRDARYQADLGSQVRLVILDKKTVRQAMLALYKHLQTCNAAVVLAFNHQLAIACVIARRLGAFRGSVVARTGSSLTQRMALTRGLWQRRIVPALTRRMYNQCDHVIAQSTGMAQDLIDKFNFAPEQITTIGNPVAVDVGSTKRAPQMDVAGRRKTVLFVGRLEDVKDPLFLIRGFAECLRRQPDLQLSILGVGSLEAQMRATAQQLGISGSIAFLGFRHNLTDIYGNAAVTVLCSRVEGLPNCLLESMAAGTPVVALDCPHGPAEIIIDQLNGLLVRERSETDFAAAILRVVEQQWDPDAIRRSVARFGLAAIVGEYERVLAHAVAR